MTTLRSWYAMGFGPFIARLAAIGAVAGVASWALVFALSPLFDTGRPDALVLLSAVLRGALVGVVLAVLLRTYWNRQESGGR